MYMLSGVLGVIEYILLVILCPFDLISAHILNFWDRGPKLGSYQKNSFIKQNDFEM